MMMRVVSKLALPSLSSLPQYIPLWIWLVPLAVCVWLPIPNVWTFFLPSIFVVVQEYSICCFFAIHFLWCYVNTILICCFRKRKAEDEPDTATKKVKTEEEETMRKQNKTMFRHRDELSKALSKKHLSLILEDNEQYIPKGESKVRLNCHSCCNQYYY